MVDQQLERHLGEFDASIAAEQERCTIIDGATNVDFHPGMSSAAPFAILACAAFQKCSVMILWQERQSGERWGQTSGARQKRLMARIARTIFSKDDVGALAAAAASGARGANAAPSEFIGVRQSAIRMRRADKKP